MCLAFGRAQYPVLPLRCEKSESASVPVGVSSVPVTAHRAAVSSKAPEELSRARVLPSRPSCNRICMENLYEDI